ncbi:MAG: lactonase family protein [Treponema sp.]|jgi:6-phosphogluconolactonase|nr:lactonase family protein [Treponema sp.]
MVHSGYIGTYTEGAGGRAKGIYSIEFNSETGVVEDIHLAAEAVNPGYLARRGKFFYAVNEVASYGKLPTGAVSAFAVEKDKSLRFLNYKTSGAAGPCHISLSRDGAWAIVANYSGGLLEVLPIGKDGRLGEPVQAIQFTGKGPNKVRQEKAHCHSFWFSPDYRYGFACDLGTDRIMAYRFDRKAKKPLSPAEPPFTSSAPGAGPRHGCFCPSGNHAAKLSAQYAYFLNELDSTVDSFSYKAGVLTKTGTVSALPEGLKTESIAAAIRISGDGRFVYTSNRGHDSIAVFKADPAGKLSFRETVDSGGKHPRDFAIDPSGNFLIVLHKDSDNLVVFRINQKTGALKKEREYPVFSPTALLF